VSEEAEHRRLNERRGNDWPPRQDGSVHLDQFQRSICAELWVHFIFVCPFEFENEVKTFNSESRKRRIFGTSTHMNWTILQLTI
jgi:hypothetical protein